MDVSRLRPVMADTALMCPRFSATSTSATGAISRMARASKAGAVNFGRPTQAACATGVKSMGAPRPSTLVSTQYSTYETISPTRMRSFWMAPRANTATRPTLSAVSSAIQRSNSLALTPLTTTGARFRPMTATTAPVTTGGISRSIQPVPTALTSSPIST